MWYLELNDHRVSGWGSDDNVGTSGSWGAVGANGDNKLAVYHACWKCSLQLLDQPVARGCFCDALKSAHVQLVVKCPRHIQHRDRLFHGIQQLHGSR